MGRHTQAVAEEPPTRTWMSVSCGHMGGTLLPRFSDLSLGAQRLVLQSAGPEHFQLLQVPTVRVAPGPGLSVESRVGGGQEDPEALAVAEETADLHTLLPGTSVSFRGNRPP